ncbi:DNA polymerase III subunit gamma and tau [Georgenia sunbinii]|uniref:DNA polymerase III subunit gamma and tau n=1 Tax=Georgenia sunbinii TaxID=3117728 RepID=UPI002F260A86
MSTALYRRYRPETFADVIGQEHVTDPLMSALRGDRISHAYLFSGPRGCGKTTSARIFARCLNCEQGPTDTPCGTCPSCVDLARGGAGSLDVVEMDAASHGGVDDARELRERAAFAPARDRYKIFIIDEAHMVTSQGFNALLKLVEEPPAHVKFVFATTEPEKVIGTIRSRTHHYPFRLVPPERLQSYLEELCAAEGVSVDGGVLPLVVRAGGGSVRDSLSVLDQLIAGAQDGTIDYERAVALLGYTHATLLDDVVDAIAAADGAALFRVVDRVIGSGHDPRRFAEDVLERLRDLIVIAVSGEHAATVLRSLPQDQLDRMRIQAQQLGPAQLSRSGDLVNEALSEMSGATSPRLQLELLCARLLLPAAGDAARGFGARLERLENQLTAGAVPAPATGGAGGQPASVAPAPAASAPQPQRTPDRPVAPDRAPSSAPWPTAAAEGRPDREPAATQPSTAAAAAAPPVAAGSSPGAQQPTASRWPTDSASAAQSSDSAASSPAPQQPTVSREPADSAPRDGAGQQQSPGTAPQQAPTETAAPRQDAPPQETTADRPVPQQARPEQEATSPPQQATTRPQQAAPQQQATAPHQQAPQQQAPQQAPQHQPPAQEAPRPAAGQADAELVRRRWPEVLATLARFKRTTWALVSQNAQVADVSGGVLQLAFTTSGLAHTFRNGQHTEALQRALSETLGVDVRIEPVLSPAAQGGGGPQHSQSTGWSGEAPAGGGHPGPSGGASSAWGAASPSGGQPPADDPGGEWSGGSNPGHDATSSPADLGRGASGGPAGAATGPGRWAGSAAPAVGGSVGGGAVAGAHGPASAGASTSTGTAVASPASAGSPAWSAPSPPAAPHVAPADDTPSMDDPDAENSELSGAKLIEKMLGGTVIEEIED